jgi:hypothetical protein
MSRALGPVGTARKEAKAFVAQLRHAVAAFHHPFSSCEVSYASDLLSARQHCLSDLHIARGLTAAWAPLAPPPIDLAHSHMASPKDHAGFVAGWNAILDEAAAQAAASASRGSSKRSR